MPKKPALKKMKIGQASHQIRTDILREKRAEYSAEIVATLSRQLGWSRRNLPCEPETKRLQSPVNIGNLDDAENDLGVGQLLSVSAAHGALMRSETIAVPSKMNGSGNAGGISRRSLFQWMGLFGLFARFFGKEKVQAYPTGGAEEIPDPEWLVKWRAANRKPIWESCDPRIQAIIRAIRLNQDVSIRYFGGNSPGEPRVIVPSLAFQCDGFSGTWVSAYCRTRGQHRTFRSDQIELS